MAEASSSGVPRVPAREPLWAAPAPQEEPAPPPGHGERGLPGGQEEPAPPRGHGEPGLPGGQEEPAPPPGHGEPGLPGGQEEPAPPPGQVLPIYFVGDESHSMAGAPMAAVNQGLVDLRDEVAKHPLLGKKVRFGVITFADTAQTRLELSELSEELVFPTLAPRGRGTSYAAALQALRQAIPADVALLKRSGYRVHRPTVFFLSDGQPTEDEERWRPALGELGALTEHPNVLAFGVGDADAQVIARVASVPRYGFMMRDGVSTAGAIAEFAASMLNSMVSSAERLDRGERTVEFEKPEGFVQLDAEIV